MKNKVIILLLFLPLFFSCKKDNVFVGDYVKKFPDSLLHYFFITSG